MAQPQTRKLVGFTLPKDAIKPEEGHLVLKGKDISGNVTSCEYSPTVDAIIGLAYVAEDQCQTGSRFPIRVDNGFQVEAEVVDLPFFDPNNDRQTL
jgi:sarcosine oxidase subunit alpha